METNIYDNIFHPNHFSLLVRGYGNDATIPISKLASFSPEYFIFTCMTLVRISFGRLFIDFELHGAGHENCGSCFIRTIFFYCSLSRCLFRWRYCCCCCGEIRKKSRTASDFRLRWLFLCIFVQECRVVWKFNSIQSHFEFVMSMSISTLRSFFCR